jgi:hypothetical protein
VVDRQLLVGRVVKDKLREPVKERKEESMIVGGQEVGNADGIEFTVVKTDKANLANENENEKGIAEIDPNPSLQCTRLLKVPLRDLELDEKERF